MSDQQYEVTARKYRPRTFQEVVGQQHVTQTLQNALKKKQLHHAYLFTGPRGTGKTTTARLLAMALNCRTSDDMVPEPCTECESCQAIITGNSVDVLEIDGASNRGIDQIRDLKQTVGYAAFEGRYKVYIVDEVHMLTKEAFNALLKTLEEPPSHVVFIFATTEPGKVLPTIMSRVQRYDFHRIGVSAMANTLTVIAKKEGLQVEEDALHLIAARADGSLRDAESLLDQVRAFAGDSISLEAARGVVDTDRLFGLTRVSVENDAAGALQLANMLAEEGQDPREFMLSYAEHLRNLIAALVGGEQGLEMLPPAERQRYLEQVGRLDLVDYLRRFELVSRAAQSLRDSPQPWIALEVTFLQLAEMDRAVDLRELLGRIDENIGGGGASGGGGQQKRAESATEKPRAKSAPPDSSSESRAAKPLTGDGRKPTAGTGVSSGRVRDAGPPVPPTGGGRESTAGTGASAGMVRDAGPPVPPTDVYESEMEPEDQGVTDRDGGNGKGAIAEEARAHWKEILEEIRKRKVSLHAFLAEAELEGVEKNQLLLAFRGDNHTFHINMVNRHSDMIREVTRDILGHSLGVKCVKAKMQKEGGGEKGADRGDLNHELLERLCEQDPNLKAIVDIFDARLEDGHGGKPDA
jgi:DNA polymerase-3 subunit gamma/tau